MNIQSGRKGAGWKSDQPVKGTKYGLSRLMGEEKPSSVPNSVSGDIHISGTFKGKHKSPVISLNPSDIQ